MEWEVFKLDQTGGRTAPFVSIGRGQLDFNAVACELVGDDGEYKFAQILTGKERGKAVVAVKFLKEYEENSIPIKRKAQQNGKSIQVGKDGSNKGMVRHKVEPIGENILKIID